MIEEFNKYTSNYDMNKMGIKLKYDHSFRVMERSIEIANHLNLNEEDKYLAKLIGLLHDFGRFEQLNVYATYDDSKSIDHADYAVDILFKDGLIRNFNMDNKYDNIIKVAIKNHNKFEIENDLNDRELLHSKIIRDADKIDILYNIAYLNYIKIEESEDSISEEVNESFENQLTIRHSYLKNNNDKIISFLSYVFDINYIYSMIYLVENKIIDKIYEKLEHKEIFESYFKSINKYLNECLKEEIKC